LVREGDLNQRQPTLVVPDSASLSVKRAPVDSRLTQLEGGTCHTLWHRLDLDFVFDNRTPDDCQTTQVDVCRFILERWPADLLTEVAPG
jgi:hypothetical protein